MSRVIAVQGLGWGSEAKGSIASMLAHSWKPDTVASAWAPNAGHTAYIDGQKFVHSMLPLGALAPSVRSILLGPGTVLDVAKLREELVAAMPLVRGKSLIIHPAATLLSGYDTEGERGLVRIGSTMKGSAHAAIRKMMRGGMYPDVPQICRDAHDSIAEELGDVVNMLDIQINETSYDHHVDAARKILLEGAQGYGLGVHQGRFYPYTTSRDVSTAQLLADCRIPFQPVTTIGVCRTLPIRVANRFEDGTLVGTSGPAYPEQRELDWNKDMGREPELTTVTKLPRRIFEFSMQQVKEACRVMQPSYLALTFCDYLGGLREYGGNPYLADEAVELAWRIRNETGIQVRWVTTSPTEIWRVINASVGLVAPVGEEAQL